MIAKTELLKMLDEGKSFAEIVRLSRSEADDARKRCALVRCFDARLYSILVAGLEGPPSFDEFILQDDVSRVPGTKLYALRAEERQRYADEWIRSDPAGYREWNARLARDARDTQDIFGYLYHLALSDPATALREFTREFDAAEKALEITQCHGLVEIIGEAGERSGPEAKELLEAWQTRRQRFETLALFSEEYFQTASYFRRDEVIGRFEAMLDGAVGPKWIWHIYASGGMGKTMLLRWLISRRLVPDLRIPCALVDYDFLRPVNVGRYPWLVLLPIVDQLNRQIAPANRFGEILYDLREYWQLLRYTGARAEATPATAIKSALERDSPLIEGISERMGLALQGAKLTTPVVIALDTLEGATLAHGGGLTQTVQYIAQLRDFEPRLRLILSGRYNIADRLDAFRRTFGDVTAVLELPRLADDEANGLLALSGVTNADMTHAIRKRAEGNPFKLSLFAEFVRDQPQLEAVDIHRLPSVDVAYLIERVVKRIPDQPTRWLVRYGSMPRQITKRYIEDVMVEQLKTALAGDSVLDTPKDVPAGLERFAAQDVWTAEPGADVSPEQLWERLRSYASSHAWIYTDRNNPAIMHLHPDVVDPMRRLLRQQKIYYALHDLSQEYYERQAQADPERWAEHIAEAIYHRFQRYGTAAETYWREKLGAPEAQSNPVARARLAIEITGEAYAEDERKPLEHFDGTPMVRVPVLIEAHYEAGIALVACGGRLRGSVELEASEARRHLDIADELQAEHGHPVEKPAAAALIRASALYAEKRYAEAQEQLVSALQRVPQDSNRFYIMVALADVLAATLDPRAREAYEGALALGHTLGMRAEVTAPIHSRLASAYVQQGNFSAAMREYIENLEEASQAGSQRVEELAWMVFQLALDINDTATAVVALRYLPSDGVGADRRVLAEGCLQLAHLNAEDAVTLALSASKMAEDPLSRALTTDLTARAQADLLAFPAAFDLMSRARGWYLQAGAIIGPERCLLIEATISLEAGNYRQARSALEGSNRSIAAQDARVWVGIECLRFITDYLMGTPGEHREFTRTASEVSDMHPSLLATLLLTGMATGNWEPSNAEQFEVMCTALGHISPASAALTLTSSLAWCDRPIAFRPEQKRRFLAFFKDALGNTANLAMLLHGADVLRVVGELDKATKLLRWALRHPEAKSPSALQKVMLLAGRLASAGAKLPRRLPDGAELAKRMSNPLAQGIMLVEEAGRALHHHSRKRARKLLDEAAPLLEAESYLTRWHGEAKEIEAALCDAAQDFQGAWLARQQARSIYTDLGDARRLSRLPPESSAEAAAKAALVATGPVRVTLKRATTGEWMRHAYSRDQGVRSIVDELVRPLISSDGNDLAPDLLRRFYDDWGAVARQLGEVLFPGGERPLVEMARENGVVDIELSLERGPLDMLPWELAGIENVSAADYPWGARYFYRTAVSGPFSPHTVRWLQDALNRLEDARVVVDGIYGPKTTEAVRAFQKNHGLTQDGILNPLTMGEIRKRLEELGAAGAARTVLLVSPIRIWELEDSARPQSYSFELNGAYMRAGMNAHTLEYLDTLEMGALIQKLEPPVIHIAGVMKQSRAEIRIDTTRASRRYRSSGPAEGVSAAELARAITGGSRRAQRRLVILDITASGSQSEGLRQLFLRNAFAAELQRLDAVSAVVAAGLQRDYVPQSAVMIEALASGKSVGDIVRAARTCAPVRDPTDAAALLGMALFVHDPLLRPIGQGSGSRAE